MEEVRFSLKWFPEHQEMWNDPWEGCPWTPSVFWSALCAGRAIGHTEDAVNRGLTKVTAGMNAAGCNAYNDPWGFTDAAGQVGSPEARALTVKQIPMILRGQRPDGVWGDHSYAVFRALVRHGLFDDLRGLPPQPPDWDVVRAIPAPDGKLSSLGWDGVRFWTFDRQTGEAVAISPEDGRVHKRVALQNGNNIAWWDGALAVAGKEPKELRKVDPETGEVLQTISLEAMEWVIGPEVVDDRALVGDGFMCNVSIFDPSNPDKSKSQVLGGPGPMYMAGQNGAVWHTDFWAPAIIKSNLKGELLDWGDQPFTIRGLAFDGEHLWAIDGDINRICALRKSKAQ